MLMLICFWGGVGSGGDSPQVLYFSLLVRAVPCDDDEQQQQQQQGIPFGDPPPPLTAMCGGGWRYQSGRGVTEGKGKDTVGISHTVVIVDATTNYHEQELAQVPLTGIKTGGERTQTEPRQG